MVVVVQDEMVYCFMLAVVKVKSICGDGCCGANCSGNGIKKRMKARRE